MSCILFFDDLNVLSYDNLQRMQGKPVWRPEATLEDELTEGTSNFPCVWRDEEVGMYRAVYGAPLSGKGIYSTPPMYAESPDGITWTIPDLREELNLPGEILAVNQVCPSTPSMVCGPAFFDAHDPDPERRLKAFVMYEKHRALITSPIDGKHWKVTEEYKTQRNTDFPISLYYNNHQEKYVVSGRQLPPGRRADRRTITIMETEDWQSFSQPRNIAHLTPNDPKLCDFYGKTVFAYEDMYVGILLRIFGNNTVNQIPCWGGMVDSVLTYSYDGRFFNRCFNDAFIEPNELGEHGCGQVYTTSMLIDETNQIRFYSGASKSEHFLDRNLKDAALILHTMRLDGFYYLKTLSSPGHLRTMPMTVKGDDLRINVSSPYGSVKIQLLDEEGNVIEGCSYEDGETFRGDELFWTPEWKSGKRGFSACKEGDIVFLEMELTSAALYAIRGDFETFTLYTNSWDVEQPQEATPAFDGEFVARPE
jgi:hypothetical protein